MAIALWRKGRVVAYGIILWHILLFLTKEVKMISLARRSCRQNKF